VDVWNQVLEFLGQVPPAVWVAAMVANLILTVATWSVARRRVRRAGERLANPELVAGRRRRDTALTVAALVPAALFLTMVVAGSMHGLVAFGLNVLGWHDGWEYLVPATLDGVSVAFAFLAFRAVRRGKAPDRCYRVVWGAAGASASINFSYEYSQSGNLLAGGYVGLLSVLGMVMFHEFLSQFEDGTDNRIRRENPKFGLRWLTWPSNTLLAAIAWRNHPPAEGTPGTVAAAVANLNRVREAKRAGRARSPIHAAPPTAPARTPAAARTVLTMRPDLEPAATGGDRPPARRPAGLRRRPLDDGDLDGGDARVPTTASTVAAWAETWVRMSADEELLSGPLTDDELARSSYGSSARQLRRLRKAVLSGALRHQAERLGVTLPQGFVDAPQVQAVEAVHGNHTAATAG
jgi:Protein of unknown function (DUF2637)